MSKHTTIFFIPFLSESNLRMRYHFLLILLLFSIWNFSVTGQKYNFQVYSLESGLPQSEIWDIIQDSRGSIWVGTNGGGLCRFNGQNFEIFTTKNGLVNNQIRNIMEDSDRNLWIITRKGLSKYDGIQFTNYTEKDGFYNGGRYQIFEDKQKKGKIWFFVILNRNERKIFYYENEKFHSFSDNQNEFINNNIFSVFMSNDGKLLITTIKGLLVYDGKEIVSSELNKQNFSTQQIIVPRYQEPNGTLWISLFNMTSMQSELGYLKDNQYFKFNIPNEIAVGNIHQIIKDHQNNLWLHSGQSLIKYDGKEFTRFDEKNGLLTNSISKLLIDRENNIWLASRGMGLIRYSGNQFLIFDANSGLQSEVVRSIYEDKNGTFWFSSMQGGISKYTDKKFLYFDTDSKKRQIRVASFQETNDGEMLITSNLGLLSYQNSTLVNINDAYQIPTFIGLSDMEQVDNNYWFSTYNNGLILFDGEKSRIFNTTNSDISSNSLGKLKADSRKNVWICTTAGISKISKDLKISNYTQSDGLENDIILQITEDSTQNMWFATFGGGLSRFDGENFTNYDTEDGLSSNILYSIMTDYNGDLWAGTQLGIDKVELDSLGDITNIIHYGKYEGFSGIENNAAANYIDRSSNLWFGTIKGAIRYNAQTKAKLKIAPITQITGLDLYFRRTNWSDNQYDEMRDTINAWSHLPVNLRLSYYKNHLTFKFEALNFNAPKSIKYKWRLVGYSNDWSPTTDKTEATYSNLPAGKYTFEVKSLNSQQVWSKEAAKFTFRVQAPFWQTSLFRIIIAATLITILYIIIKRSYNKIKRKKIALEKDINKKDIEIKEQNDEIIAQNEELYQQKEEILAQAENLQRSFDNLERLSEIGKAITSHLSIEKIISTVYSQINTLIDVPIFGIGIYNNIRNTLDFPEIVENNKKIGSISFNIEDTLRLSIVCYTKRKEIFINDFESEYKDYLPAIISSKTGKDANSIIYLPLISNNKSIGVITIQSMYKNTYKEYDLNILRNIAIYTVIAINNAKVYTQIEEQSSSLISANENITYQKQQIESTNKELIELNNEKNHLIGVIAHDLRNPLSSSITVANVLKSEISTLTEEQTSYANHLIGSLNRMNNMITKILDLKVIESKKINLHLEEINLTPLFQEILTNFSKKFTAKNIEYQHNAPPEAIWLEADQSYLTQIFENLISNAIKFSPPNTLIMTILEEKNNIISIQVIDQGPGISDEDQKKLFGKYQQLTARPTNNESSTGLGLSIVKKYVEAMNGHVWCESQLDYGATFVVEFKKRYSSNTKKDDV